MTKGFKIYIYLAGLFIASLIICNLIANKFVTVSLGFKTFTISAGILPYPITFLITDLLELNQLEILFGLGFSHLYLY